VPRWPATQLYRSATRIGAHIASVVNTIVLAYAGRTCAPSRPISSTTPSGDPMPSTTSSSRRAPVAVCAYRSEHRGLGRVGVVHARQQR
jgi:hypothetical protein